MLARPAVLPTATTPEPRLPRFAQFWCDASPFRIDTSTSVSKQTTSTLFRMNTYGKHTGWGSGGGVQFFLLRIRHSSLATGLKFFLFTFFRTLLRVFAFMQSSTPFFSNAFSLFAKKKHPAWGQTKNGGALPAVMGASAERAYRLQERRSSTILRSLRMSTVLRSSRTLLRFSFPAVEAEEAYSSEIFLGGLARWCSPRAPRTALPPVPSAGCSSACTLYFQNGDQNACS